MFGRKTKRIKELESEVLRLKKDLEWCAGIADNEHNESANLRIENNRLRAKMSVHGANGRFIPRG